MKKILIIISLVAFSINCKSQSCKDLPEKFYSYSSAIDAIKSADFNYTDELPSGSSSWITAANFYSCDGKYGYFIYSTDKGHEYIHENVPKSLWVSFTEAYSKGSFYVENIKKRYRLIPD